MNMYGVSAAYSGCLSCVWMKIPIAVSIVSEVLEASPFQITTDGFSSSIFVSTWSRTGLRSCVSLITQKEPPCTPAPSVVNECTFSSTSGPRFAMSYPPLKTMRSAPMRYQ